VRDECRVKQKRANAQLKSDCGPRPVPWFTTALCFSPLCAYLMYMSANEQPHRGHKVNRLLRHDDRNLAAVIAILNVIGVVSSNVSLSGLDVSFVNILKVRRFPVYIYMCVCVCVCGVYE
jgi:TRAP-type uncharacterized transport system fused permease subunit